MLGVVALLWLAGAEPTAAATPPPEAGQPSPDPASALPPLPRHPVSGKLAKIMAKSNGLTSGTAYKVRSISDEYEILHALELEPVRQALVVDHGKSFDMIKVHDNATNSDHDVWFDFGGLSF